MADYTVTNNIDTLLRSTSNAAARTNLGLGDAATKNTGTTAGTVAAGDDSRLSNARTPTAHAASHAAAGSDPITLNASQVSGALAASNLPALTGDVTSTAGTASVTVTKLQGNAVASGAPSSGQVLKWNGTAWAGAADTTGITALTGDVTASGSGSVAATLSSTGVVPGDYGSGVAIPVLSVNSKGRITTAYETPIEAVTSVSGSGGTTGLTLAGGPITTTGTLTIGGTLAIANGGTGATTQQAALNAVAGATTSGQFLRGNGTNVTMSAIQAADVPTLNQNTTGTASNVTGTVLEANGGTGETTYTNGQILIGNATGGLTKATLTAGSNVTITNGDGAITIDATGGSGSGTVTSITAGTGLTGGTITTSGTIAADFGSTTGKVTEGGTTVLKSGDTMTGKLVLGAGSTTAPVNLGASSAPVSPATGDLWLSASNVLNYRGYNSATYPIVSTASLPSFTAGVSAAIGSASVAALAVAQNGAGPTVTVANVATSTSDCVTITNLGTGNSLVVNDETTPDSTRFAIANNGRVGIGVAPDASIALTLDTSGMRLGGASGPTITSGTGSPEGVVTAPIGSLFLNLSGGASTTLYVKTSGAGNTGWTAK